MTNSTDVYWDVEGFSLQTYAYNIETWGASGGGGQGPEAPPPLRGSNLIIPGRPGQYYMSKMPDSRIISFSMWVVGANADGSVPSDGNMRAVFEYNFKSLRNLMMTPYRQFKLTKRFREYGSSTVKTATALAEYAGGLDISMTGELRGFFTVDLLLADPYFYEPEVTSPTLTAAQLNLNIPGDARTFRVTANFAGALTNPQIQNITPAGTVSAQLNSTLGAGDTAYMDSYNMKAVFGQIVSSKVTHSGSPMWLFLDPGQNLVTLNAASGSGPATLTYQAAHL